MTTRKLLIAALSVITWTSIAASPASAQAAPGETIYETQFADTAQAAEEWDLPADGSPDAGDGFSFALEPGTLVVTLDGAPNVWISPNVADLPRDQIVEARLSPRSDAEPSLFGVACRARLEPRSLGYVFAIASDGYYTIAKYDGSGKARKLVNAGKNERFTDAVDPEGPNIVQGDCIGSKQVKLTLSVNGEKVASFVDKKPPKVGDSIYVVSEAGDGPESVLDVTGFAVSSPA